MSRAFVFLGLVGLILSAAVAGSGTAQAQFGTVRRVQKLLDPSGAAGAFGFDGGDRFGSSIAAIGDVDGDGIGDLAVGAARDEGGRGLVGTLAILFMRGDGQVRAVRKLKPRVDDLVWNGGRSDFGYSVAGIGDLNRDGVPDVAVGQPGFTYVGKTEAGAVSILFLDSAGGAAGYQRIGDHDGAPENFELDEHGYFGFSVAAIGDLNRDGVTDLAVGAVRDNNGIADDFLGRGAVYILFMRTDGTVASFRTIHDATGSPADFALDDADHFGSSIAAVGDLDGDGNVDLAVGANGDDDGGDGLGALYLLYLARDGTASRFRKLSATTGIPPDLVLPQVLGFGRSVAALGDLNGDAVGDLAVGAGLAPELENSLSGRGAVYLLFMRADATVAAVHSIRDGVVDPPEGRPGCSTFGASLAQLGDFDEDDIPELGVGCLSDGSSDGESYRGAVYTLYLTGTRKEAVVPVQPRVFLPWAGRVTAPKQTVTAVDYRKITDAVGAPPGFALPDGATFGKSLAQIGDLNQDGHPDLAVGAPGESAVYVLFTAPGGTVVKVQKISASTGSATSLGLAAGDGFGFSIAAPGDLNGDGVPDLAVGAPGDDDGSANSNRNAGAVYLLFLGRDGTVSSHRRLTADAGASDGPALEPRMLFGLSLAAPGDVNGDGLADLAVGISGRNAAGVSVSADSAVHLLFLGAGGSVISVQVISEDSGTPAGLTLFDGGGFGFDWRISAVGDVDGDGVPDLAVGVPNDRDFESSVSPQAEGAVYVMFLQRDGRVRSYQKLTDASGTPDDFSLDEFDYFGASLARVGDLNGDGVPDLAVGAYGDDDGSVDPVMGNHGAVYVLFLASNGKVSDFQKLSDTQGTPASFVQVMDNSFGFSLTAVDDLNGDGLGELAIGAPGDPGRSRSVRGIRGAFYLFFLRRGPRPEPGLAGAALPYAEPSVPRGHR